MSQALATTLGLAFACMLSACSKAPETVVTTDASQSAKVRASAAPAPVQRPEFGDLSRLAGKAPWDLVTDELIGQAVRATVPQGKFKCMDQIFNYMPDLQRQGNGSLQSSLNGSHADQFMEAFISASPNGSLNVVLNCDSQGNPKGAYEIYSNDPAGTAPPKAVLEWLYTVGSDNDHVSTVNGSTVGNSTFTSFLRSYAPVAGPAVASASLNPPAATVAAPAPAPAPAPVAVAAAPIVPPSAGRAADAGLMTRCTVAAIGSGYVDGQCAYSFINACVTTQSKSAMERALETDRMLGAVQARGCINMPRDYVQAFNEVNRKADKF